MYEVWHDDGLYGVAGLTSIDWVNRRAEFSLYINPDCQSKGFGEAALRHLLKHGFEVLNLNLIWGESFDGNPAMRLFSRVGMRPMGVRRQFYFRDGKYLDAYLWDITKAEFEGKHDPSNINHLTSGINCRFEHGLGIKAEEKKTKGTPDDPPPGIGA